MNCESCELPKNSLRAATTGRMLMMDCGVMVSDVLRGHALADHAFHPVEAHPEGLLHQLAHHAQAAVAEVLVFVQPVGHLVPGKARGHFGQVAGFFEQVLVVDGQGHRHQLPHQSDDVGLGEGTDVQVGVKTQPRVELVPARPG